jgi:hypothetical protein
MIKNYQDSHFLCRTTGCRRFRRPKSDHEIDRSTWLLMTYHGDVETPNPDISGITDGEPVLQGAEATQSRRSRRRTIQDATRISSRIMTSPGGSMVSRDDAAPTHVPHQQPDVARDKAQADRWQGYSGGHTDLGAQALRRWHPLE